MPDWNYQIRLASGEVEKRIKSQEQIRQFLNAVYGARGAGGEVGFSLSEGPLYDVMPRLGRTGLMGEEVLGFYAREYGRNGMRGCGESFYFSLFFLKKKLCRLNARFWGFAEKRGIWQWRGIKPASRISKMN